MKLSLPGVFLLATCGLLSGCATPGQDVAQRIEALLPADVILLGEQHDAPDHQRVQRAMVLELAQRGQLAALAIEMAEQGHSTTALKRDAPDAAVRSSLRWNDAGWPWEQYGPVVMAAVQSGVPVLGANLPRAAMRQAMGNEGLDRHLSPVDLERQRDNIRAGHCGLLPESQIAPMTRIQIARDAAMAQTVVGARQDGKTVLLIAGGAHVRRSLGVPTHLPLDLRLKVVLAVAGERDDTRPADLDLVWGTAPVADKDHCDELRKRLKG